MAALSKVEDIDFFSDAVYAAERSTIKRHRTGAAIYDANWNLLSIGWSHRTQEKLARTPWSMHAEHHAVRRCWSRRSLASKIVIVTLTSVAGFTCGKPCEACADLLNRVGISEIYYSERKVDDKCMRTLRLVAAK